MTDPRSVFPVQASDIPRAANVLAVYNGASGLERRRGEQFWLNAWRASRALAETHWHHGTQRRTIQAAGIVAALSQLKGWDHNLELAVEAFANKGVLNGGTFPTVAAKVQAIFDGKDPAEVLSGPKVAATFWSIVHKGETNHAVVIDRHAAHIAYGRIMDDGERNRALRQYVSRDGYAAVVAAYRAAASHLGKPAAIVQATTRIAWTNALLGEDRGFTAAEKEELSA